jgi:hypothetical protein
LNVGLFPNCASDIAESAKFGIENLLVDDWILVEEPRKDGCGAPTMAGSTMDVDRVALGFDFANKGNCRLYIGYAEKKKKKKEPTTYSHIIRFFLWKRKAMPRDCEAKQALTIKSLTEGSK